MSLLLKDYASIIKFYAIREAEQQLHAKNHEAQQRESGTTSIPTRVPTLFTTDLGIKLRLADPYARDGFRVFNCDSHIWKSIAVSALHLNRFSLRAILPKQEK